MYKLNEIMNALIKKRNEHIYRNGVSSNPRFNIYLGDDDWKELMTDTEYIKLLYAWKLDDRLFGSQIFRIVNVSRHINIVIVSE